MATMALTAPTLPPPRWTVQPVETGGQIFGRLSTLIEPKEYISVSEWARINTNFDLEALPWHAEVMDALGDPETAEVFLLGPSQAGKSTIGLCWIGYVTDREPGDFGLVQPGRKATHTFVKTRLDPFIASTSTVKNKLLDDPSANNMFLKQFQGMFVHSGWSTDAEFFTQRPWRYAWGDDADQIDDDIGGTEEKAGQGSLLNLINGRLTLAIVEGRDTKFISSSPADEKGGKTEAAVETGTDERLQPVCPSCGERWEIDTMRDLRFDDAGTVDQAEKTAHVNCGASGCELSPDQRRPLLRSLIGLPNRGFVATREASKRRRTFRIDGLMVFTSWEALAREWREAQIAWHSRQDEGPMRTFVNTRAGKNYRSILSGEKPLAANDLAKRREPGFAIGTVPAGVKVIVIVVDAQAHGFECAAIGWGDKLESWLIDRWAIHLLDDGTPLRPFADASHAEVLRPLWRKTWPMADGSGDCPPPLSVAIDTGGGGTKEDSWTNAAKGLWHKVTAPSHQGGWGIERRRITLIKGGNNPKGRDLMPPAQFADKKVRGGAQRRSPDLWMPNVHRLKNIIDARLRIDTPGPGYIHLPGADRPGSRQRIAGEDAPGLSDQYLEEITAEELKKGKWTKQRPRNETWDHLVMAYASILKPPFAQSRDTMRWVPRAFRVRGQELPMGQGSNDQDGADVRSTTAEPAAPLPPETEGGGHTTAAARAAPKKKRRGGINKLTGRATGSWLKR